ncbi:MAG: hypothetical protein E6Q59_04030 [Nitrosomonas sp.]|nr:MAG: hypothetical protein E6Q59_04030 [Nitrosomonas sp.]
MSDEPQIDLSKANNLPARGDELLRIFARFEFALKESGYGVSGKNDEAGADWDRFANQSLTAKFLHKIREKNIAPTILEKSPSKQIFKDHTLEWTACAPPQDVQTFFGAVRRVRNNLVHGGKSGDKDADRNNSLVSEAIEVLFEALRSDSHVRSMFEGQY